MSPGSLPIIAHQSIADADCCGCLMVRTRGDQADIFCNECGVVVRTIAASDVEAVLSELSQTDLICSATCTHCGALNTFPGMSSVIAFICRECGEGVDVLEPVQ
jgi:hypothetical protein